MSAASRQPRPAARVYVWARPPVTLLGPRIPGGRGPITEVVPRADGGSDKELRTQRSAGTAAPSPGRPGGRRGVWEVRLAVQDARGSPAPAGLRRLFQRPVLLSGPKLPPGSRAGGPHPSSPTLAVQIPVPGGRHELVCALLGRLGPPPGSEDSPHSPVRCLLRTPVRHGAGMEGLLCPAERRPVAAPNQAPRGRLFASPPHPPRSAGTG